ncbi:LMBR1 domain-containing protein 2-B [Strigomonas culicis]|uniref:LMBR1 domain-containing protein 2-B n=1 Tax=Strigomonas culicis TaxID=28005 RepID=S9VB43_9TRYP|nr:LMBR1 domain-containing protein 2-B [Strigomonas culicis]EPY30082.1 LMBR1 domain-containing protein 2-B [Strigomonas culicis]|eukprot:EPY24246.1 LMBR1 domain-containing protein 2-B [Strigomonas culicis]
MSGGYVALVIIFFVLAFAVSLAAYYYYTKESIKTMSIHCAIWHVISLYMCVLPFPLLVVDIQAAMSGGAEQTWMRPIWVMIFAMTYICAWITLPVAQMYTIVGDFTWKKRLVQSIKVNLIIYAVILVLVLGFLTYLVILKGAYTSFASTLKVIISLANAWGLLILTFFMPAGLVGVPRMLWKYADPKRLLRRRLYDAVNIQEDLDLSAMDLATIKAELISIDPLVSDDNRPHLTQMLEAINKADHEVPLYHLAAQRVHAKPLESTNDISLEHLVELNKRLKKAIIVVGRANYRWTKTLRECVFMDDFLKQRRDTPWMRLWYKLRKPVYWTGCGVCTILTILILWSEQVMPFREAAGVPLGVIELVMHSSVHFVASIVLLFYMAYCTYWAAFQFKVFDVYVVYPSIADNASLCFNETFLVRLLMPLCFNFLLISHLNTSEDADAIDVQYGHVYRKNMDISLLFGAWLNRFLPMCIPIIAAVVFFNLAQRMLALVGIEVHNPNDVESAPVRQRIEDGRRLVENELGFELASVVLPGEQPFIEGETPSRIKRMAGGAERDATTPPSGSSATKGNRYREYLERKKKENGGQETPRNGEDIPV